MTVRQDLELWIFDLHPPKTHGGTLDFMWQGWSKDFFEFEISYFGIFLVGKIWASIFLGWFKYGFFGVFKTDVSFFRVISFNAFWKCLWLGNSAWDFSGLNFGSGTIWGFCLKAKGVFRVMIFAPIRLSPSLEIRIRPPPPPSLGQKVTNFSTHTSALSHWQGLR